MPSTARTVPTRRRRSVPSEQRVVPLDALEPQDGRTPLARGDVAARRRGPRPVGKMSAWVSPPAAISSLRRQAARWSLASPGASSGSRARHDASASGQRGANGQPGGSRTADGGLPSTLASARLRAARGPALDAVPGPAPGPAPGPSRDPARGPTSDPVPGFASGRTSGPTSNRGTAPSSPIVYGMRGRWKIAFDTALLDRPAGVHHRHAIGDPGDHAEIVGDDEQRRPALAPRGVRAPRAPAPAPSRRGRSSARRR